MDSRRLSCSPALLFALPLSLFALLPTLLCSLSCSGRAPAVGALPAASDASVIADQATDRNFEGAQSQIARHEYRVSANRNGLQAPNRAHGLRTYFEPTGIRVHDRTRADSSELLSLKLSGVGRGETLAAVGPGEVTSDGARVEIARPGLIEWYENSAAGLEHGITLAERPAGGDAPLVVELSLSGAQASLHGESLSFATPSDRRLSYAKLVVVDARGRTLDARFELPESSRLQLVVDDAAADYPIAIDPLLTGSADTQLESNQAGANMGVSVAGAGDVNGDGYDDVIVGASSYDAGESNEGAAFIFLGSAAGIADANPMTAASQLESNQANAYLGASVAGAGDVNDDGYDDVIVGAYLYDAGQVDEGAAFVFLGSAAGIADGNPSTAASWLESDQANASMGWSVDGAGDVDNDGYDDVIVGAYIYDTGLSTPRCTAGGTPGGKPFFCCTGPAEGACFDEGAAFIFLGSAAGVADASPATAATQLQANQPDSWLGWSVARAGDVNGDGFVDAIVGANAWDLFGPAQPISQEGAAFIFLGTGAGIPDGTSSTAATRLESSKTGSLMGSSVAAAGDVNGDGFDDVIVGANLHEIGAVAADEGVAFVYLGRAGGIPNGTPFTAATRLEANQGVAYMGASVAGAGDVDGDGYDDVIVGASRYDAGETNEGAAFVYLGSASGIPNGNPSTAAVQLESNQSSAWLGFQVASAGDVNGDGSPDVIVGAPNYDAPLSGEGAAFIFLSEPASTINVPEPALIAGLAVGLPCLAILARLSRRSARPTRG